VFFSGVFSYCRSFTQGINYIFPESESIFVAYYKAIKIMRKDKKENDSVDNLKMDFNSLPLETDQAILEQINKRNDENQALKKLLDNLNSSLPKPESKPSNSASKSI
jgi:hypothetical protein